MQLCECGCGRQTAAQFVSGHNRLKLWDRFIEDLETNCWIWLGCRNPDGYGYFRRRGKRIAAHRTFYEAYIGPIPTGLTIDHLCRNRACVNPGHLEPVTRRENILRGEANAAKNARKTECIHGHPFTEENTYRDPQGARKCRTCKRIRNRERKRRLRKAAAA